MKKEVKWQFIKRTAIIAVTVVIGLSMVTCDADKADDVGKVATVISVTADGSSTQTTTQLSLTFDKAIEGLSATDITLSGVSGVSKGTLNGSNPYTLSISGFTSGGTLSVVVAKSGYAISNSPKTVVIFHYSNGSDNNIVAAFINVTANGSSTQTTTQLTLTFDKAISGLTADDIALSGVPGVSKGTLSGSNPYTLPISGFTSGETLSVAVAKAGYDINYSPRTVVIFHYSESGGNNNTVAAFNSVYANGSPSQTTTQLTLTFDKAISGLTADDITLSGVSNVNKGTLSGSNSYTLPISGFTSGGTLSVAVAKASYDINYSPKTVAIFYSSSILNYIGSSSSLDKQYRLTITDNNSFELHVGTKISSGTAVQNGSQWQWTLSPQGGVPFTVQLSSGGIVQINGGITFNDGSYETAPGMLTPIHSGNGVFVSLNSVTGFITSQLTLIFDKAISGLTADDIALSGVPGVSKGTLSGSNPYTLPISGFTFGETLSVAVSKTGYDIYGSPKTVNVMVEMIQIPGGSFQMGSNSDYSNEQPVHTVTLSSFNMGKYEVTQEQWIAVMGNNPSSFTSSPASGEVQSKRPVERVSWYDTLVFCNKLSMMEGLSPAYRISGSTDPANWETVPTSNNSTWNAVQIVVGSNGYRLPTEAQWEYAARGGNGSPGNYTYSGSDTVGDVAWYSGNSGNKTHEVGKKAPNGLGLYDMSGNVWEWCWDWYGSYPSGAQTDPVGADSGSYRVYHGGSWGDPAEYSRSAFRGYGYPFNWYDAIGFRLVRP
jgi:formylglycine-generating enzyme required for sulfatase activity